MYRFFEILPGVLAWGTLILMVVLSRLAPAAMAVFIILFDIYWLLKTVYLSLHLRSTYQMMKENMEVDWRAKLEQLAQVDGAPRWKDLRHLIVLPMATEPYEVVRESFESLAKENYPRENLFVVLATEKRAGQVAQETAKRIEAEFGHQFGKFLATVHPENIPGEIPGKGSNETWAVRRAKEQMLDREQIPHNNVLVSVFDADTQVFSEYFGRLSYVFLTAPNRLRAIYQPIPFFMNNVYHAPALARVVSFSATFWQMMQQSRPERLTSFSSQSIPLQALIDLGFWQTDIVSEDSRIFWQGYLHYHGDFRCEPLFYPVSMDVNAAPTFWATMKNLYKQQRRWAWGVENTPYIVSGFLRDKQIPLVKRLYWAFTDIEGRHSWATNALIIFALGWLPVALGGAVFNDTLLSYNLPRITEFIVRLSMFGIATSAILALILLPPKPKWFRRRHYVLYALQWILMPLTLIVFGCIPALDAQTRLTLGGKFRLGFWITPKGRYPETENEIRA
jgi:cellulose synthase/poly-beta-1,6-N-acetylglucosamine synthase-like glycosyltransferase